MKEASQQVINQLKAHPLIDSITHIKNKHFKIIYAPKSSKNPYTSLKLALKMELPSNFPILPPVLNFIQPIYHVNVDQKTGLLKMPLLSQEWSEFISLTSVIDQIQNIMREPDQNFAANQQIKFVFQRNPEQYFEKVKGFVSGKIQNQNYPIKQNQNVSPNKSLKGSEHNRESRTHTIQSDKHNSQISAFQSINIVLMPNQYSQISQEIGDKSLWLKNTPILHKRSSSELAASRISNSQRVSRTNLKKVRQIYLKQNQDSEDKDILYVEQPKKRDQFSKIVEQSEEQASRWQKASLLYQSKDLQNQKTKNKQKSPKQQQLIKIPQIDIQLKQQQDLNLSQIEKQESSINNLLSKVNKQIDKEMKEYKQVYQNFQKSDHNKFKEVLARKMERSLVIIQELEKLSLGLKQKLVQNLIKETKRYL